MKKYFTAIEGIDTKYEIELSGTGNTSFNGKNYTYECRFLSQGVVLLRINNKNYYMTVTGNDENGLLEINLDSKNYILSCKSELDLLLEGMSNNKSGSKVKKEIKSPMPGIIKAINIVKGQQVRKGEILLVLEAMKMENEIKAVTDGVIKSVSVDAMSSVEKNEILFEFE